MENCIFCKIVSGEIPADKTYEDENVIAFLDIHPKAPGHTLLIPKEHHRWFYELPDQVADDLFRSAKKVALQLKDKYQADFVRLGIVGTDVPHVHVHLIPQTFSQNGPEI
jgi:histidine triad (HIT) family protein